MPLPTSTPQHVGFERRLIIAFILVIGCFVGSTLMAMYLSQGISAASEDISDNVAPSVVTVASARTELRKLEVAVDDYVGRKEAIPDEAQRIRGSLQALDEDIERYYRLPALPRERNLQSPVELHRKGLREAIERTLQLYDTDRAGAERLSDNVVKPTADRLDDALQSISEYNGAEATQLARRIAVLRNRTRNSVLVLDVISAIFGVVLLILLIRRLEQNTRLIQTQQRSLEARATEMDEFSSRVAHDIRGPLQAIGLAIEMAQKGTAEPSTRGLLERGQRGLRRVRAIVDGLYDFALSGIAVGAGMRCDAAAVLTELVEELRPVASEASIELGAELRGGGEVACSEGVLSSITSNLVQNAIKYMGDGATRKITVRLLEAGPALRIEVDDTGPGIPPALQASIFEPHVRVPGTSQPGLGLGLATVKRLVVAHGGSLGVHSELHQGSRFWVELPRSLR